MRKHKNLLIMRQVTWLNITTISSSYMVKVSEVLMLSPPCSLQPQQVYSDVRYIVIYPAYPVSRAGHVGSWVSHECQPNKQTNKILHWSSAKSPQFCRWYEPGLLAASVLYKFSMTMDHISIILATIALAGIITRRVTYVNIINQFQASCFGRFGGSSTPKRHPRFSGGQLEMAEDRRIDMTDMCQNLSFLSFLTDYFRSFLFQNNLLE